MDVTSLQLPPRKGHLRQCWYHDLDALTSMLWYIRKLNHMDLSHPLRASTSIHHASLINLVPSFLQLLELSWVSSSAWCDIAQCTYSWKYWFSIWSRNKCSKHEESPAQWENGWSYSSEAVHPGFGHSGWVRLHHTIKNQPPESPSKPATILFQHYLQQTVENLGWPNKSLSNSHSHVLHHTSISQGAIHIWMFASAQWKEWPKYRK